MKKTNKNFIYNVVYQIFIYIIPLISVPYISRILGVNNIGIYSYTYTIIYYFMLISMLGINNYGSREIAKVSDDKDKLSEKFFSIYYLQLFLNIIVILFFCCFFFFSKYEYKNILLFQLPFLLSCSFDINWFFFGSEEFKITISRNIIIKILSLILIFIFVKTSNDLWIYTLIMSISTLVSQLYLWFFLKKRVVFCKPNIHKIVNNLKPCLILFVPVIAYCIYRVMDKTMIGFFSNTIELGFYESAEKIINIPLSFVTALGTVMIPHMAKTNNEMFEKKIEDSFKLCFFFMLPMIFGLLIISKNFSLLFFGDSFTKTGNIIIFLLPTLLFGAITNQIRCNYLIPKSKDNIYIKSTIYGAIINLVLNIIFIPIFGAYGACIGTVAAEFIVALYQIIKTRKQINYLRCLKSCSSFFVSSLIISILLYWLNFLSIPKMIIVSLQIILFVAIYFLINYKYLLYDFLGKKRKNKLQNI